MCGDRLFPGNCYGESQHDDSEKCCVMTIMNEEDELGGACSTRGTDDKCVRNFGQET
jgi:hypothetical protein